MAEKPESLLPYDNQADKHTQVKHMFDNIAPKYDFMNRLMSFHMDIRWRKKALNKIKGQTIHHLLDVATGTADFALQAWDHLHPDQITGIDLSEAMLHIGRDKVAARGLEAHIRLEQQDCLSLNFPKEQFEAVTVAFGVRNFENIAQGLSEMYRVLKPGGSLVFLELSRPARFPMKQLFYLYARIWMPMAGRIFTKDARAYTYLPESIQLVPQGKDMLRLLNQAGFVQTSFETYSMGTCSCYLARK